MKSIVTLATIAAVLFVNGSSPANTIIVDNTSGAVAGSQPTSATISTGAGFTMGGTSEQLGTIAAAVSPAGASLALYNETEFGVNQGPTTLVTNLTNTGTHNGLGDEIYTPTNPTTLLAGQSYMVVMTGVGNSWSYTTGASTNTLGTMDGSRWVNLGGGWFEVSQPARPLMQVNFQAAGVPEIGAGSAASAFAVLGCAVAMLRGRRWHYARSSG